MYRIGLIAAMDEELAELKKILNVQYHTKLAGMEFFIGKIDSVHVVAVKSGVGKVNAAACTQLLCDNFNVCKIISTGVSGAIDRELNVGDVVISKDLIQHDIDVTAFGYAKGQVAGFDFIEFKADEELVTIATKACEDIDFKNKVVVGRIVSGDQFISDSKDVERLRKDFSATTVEMESAAVAQVCHINKVPFLAIRSISDNADNEAIISFEEFTALAAQNSAKIVHKILNYLDQKK